MAYASRGCISPSQDLVYCRPIKSMFVGPASDALSFPQELIPDFLRGTDRSWFHGISSNQMNPYGCKYITNPNGFMSTAMSTISERLRKERKKLGLSQGEFAERLGVHRNTQARYERGEREPDTAYLEAIQTLGIDAFFVLTGARKGFSKEEIEAMPSERIHAFEVNSCTNDMRFVLDLLGISDKQWFDIARKSARRFPFSPDVPGFFSQDRQFAQEVAKASPVVRELLEGAASLDSTLLAEILERIESASSETVLSPNKKAQTAALLYRSFKVGGKIDPAIIEEAVRLASS